jgi:hypothetical protein
MQGEIRVGVTEGYSLAIRYQDGDSCNSSGSTFCNGRAPVMLDFAGGFGVLDWLEIEARFRMGVEPVSGISVSHDAGAALPLQVGAGIRAYGSDSSRLKFGFGIAALVDFTAGQRLDVVARLDEGLHYEASRYFAFYLQVGESLQPVRSLMFSLDGGIGLQGRFP